MADSIFPGEQPDRLEEECGVFGVYAPGEDVARLTCYGLQALQHRGQESAGIAVGDGSTVIEAKDLGLVTQVFDEATLAGLGEGVVAIGHVRYSTSGGKASWEAAQPHISAIDDTLIALAHNGTLVNTNHLRAQLIDEGEHLRAGTDSEVAAKAIGHLTRQTHHLREGIRYAMENLEGAYAMVLASPEALYAFRDPHGIRPLCIGQLPEGRGWVVSSETCGLDIVGAEYVRDVEPGEMVVADAKTGELRSITDHVGRPDTQMCVFEFIYFARPDSIIEGSSVHEARKQAGRFLAQEHPVEADVVIGVPDSGLDAALGYSQESGIPYGIGFIKNKYIGRTFIQGSQKQRENSVRIKLNVVSSTVKGKRVVLVDDSIVRGTTSARIIKLLRDAGAAEVHFMVSAPPFKYPCYFGTDIPDQKLLVATGRTLEQINEVIGADTLGYLSNEHVVQLAKNAKCGFCTACFTGEYAVEPESVLSTDIHDRHLNDRPKDAKKLGE